MPPVGSDPAVGFPGGHVELTVPNTQRFAALTRMTGAALASTAGFNVAEIDRLRGALDAAWSILHSSAPVDSTVRFGFDAEPQSLRLRAASDPGSYATFEPNRGPGGDGIELVHVEIIWRVGG